MTNQFPRTMVGGVSMPRLILGANWITGFSHVGPAADKMIRERNDSPEAISPIIETFLSHGLDAIMGLVSSDPVLEKAIRMAEQRTGKKVIIIDEPVPNMQNSQAGRQEAAASIKKSAEIGATFCLPLHSCVEELVNRGTRTIERIPDYLSMIRENGMIPGLSCHMPEVVQFADENEYDVETYVQIFNCMGFLMQVEIESIIKIIHAAKKPVMTIKPCAAGRVTPFVGLNFNWNVLREQDMITIGCLTPDEADEDIEYSKAAIQRRLPNIRNRNSPVITSVISGESATGAQLR